MFFQLSADAASLTVTTREGRSILFTRGEPVKITRPAEIEQLRDRSDVEECSEEGLEPRKARRPEPKSEVTFSGPSSEPPPKPAPHDPSPRELAEAKGKLEGSE